MNWTEDLKMTIKTMMNTVDNTNKRIDIVNDNINDNKDDISHLIKKSMKQEQDLINLNHKMKMLMHYLKVDYNEVVEKYNNKDEGENNAR